MLSSTVTLTERELYHAERTLADRIRTLEKRKAGYLSRPMTKPGMYEALLSELAALQSAREKFKHHHKVIGEHFAAKLRREEIIGHAERAEQYAPSCGVE